MENKFVIFAEKVMGLELSDIQKELLREADRFSLNWRENLETEAILDDFKIAKKVLNNYADVYGRKFSYNGLSQ